MSVCGKELDAIFKEITEATEARDAFEEGSPSYKALDKKCASLFVRARKTFERYHPRWSFKEGKEV